MHEPGSYCNSCTKVLGQKNTRQDNLRKGSASPQVADKLLGICIALGFIVFYGVRYTGIALLPGGSGTSVQALKLMRFCLSCSIATRMFGLANASLSLTCINWYAHGLVSSSLSLPERVCCWGSLASELLSVSGSSLKSSESDSLVAVSISHVMLCLPSL